MSRPSNDTLPADAPLENVRFSSYWEMLPSTSCPSACHWFEVFQPSQRKYRVKPSDGTRYLLREKVRFFEPFKYGVSCPELHDVNLKAVAYVELRVSTATVLSCAALFLTSSTGDSTPQSRK